MTLPLPRLDTLRYDALVAEATSLLPYRAPHWTDHNAHDPGITLIELFAWLAEANSYRLDRLPERSERTFLRLLGHEPMPARVARTVVVLQPTGGAVAVPAGVQITTADGAQRFQTATPFDAVDAHVAVRLTSTASGWSQHPQAASDWLPLGSAPAVDAALYLGFDHELPAGRRVRLFALTDTPAHDESTWQALHAEYRRQWNRTPARCRRPCGCLRPLWQHPSASTVWEYHDGQRWKALPELRDATRALSLSGPIRFRVPGDLQPGDVPGHAGTWFIRCRLARGGYDAAPRLQSLLLNAVLARHAADHPPRPLGTSSGHAQQRFDLSLEPVVPGSVQIVLTRPDATRSAWIERSDFDRSGPLARDFVVDAAAGQVVFGDGRAGRVPEASATLEARWKSGGGAGGNVPAGSLGTALGGLAVTARQPVAAWGGAAAETLGEAKARVVQAVAQARCAVTLEDFEHAALNVPGAPVARARAVAGFDPRLGGLPAAGCVSVVIVSPGVRIRPDPTPGLCRAVRCHLDARRPVTTEVHVTGPAWTAVSVHATLRMRRGPDAAALRAEAARRIDAFFDPLSGGPDGTGWPFGRPVFRSEVLALLDTLPGVAAVEGLVLVADDRPDDHCHNIALCPHGLVRAGAHHITVSPEPLP